MPGFLSDRTCYLIIRPDLAYAGWVSPFVSNGPTPTVADQCMAGQIYLNNDIFAGLYRQFEYQDTPQQMRMPAAGFVPERNVNNAFRPRSEGLRQTGAHGGRIDHHNPTGENDHEDRTHCTRYRPGCCDPGRGFWSPVP